MLDCCLMKVAAAGRADKGEPGHESEGLSIHCLFPCGAAFPRMRAWLDWFIRTQQGRLPGSWRWRGRHLEFVNDPFTGATSDLTRELNPKTLTSGG